MNNYNGIIDEFYINRKYSYIGQDTNKQQLNKCSRQYRQHKEDNDDSSTDRKKDKGKAYMRKKLCEYCMFAIFRLITTRLIFCCHN